MNINDELAAMGLAPLPDGPPPYRPPADEISDIVEPVAASISFGVAPLPAALDDAIDLRHVLDMWILRLDARLAPHGIHLTEKLEAPLVASTTAFFGGKAMQEHCKHVDVHVDEQRSHLVCRACKTLVAPMWWLARHTRELTNAQHHRDHLRAEARVLQQEVDALKKLRGSLRQQVKRAKSHPADKAKPSRRTLLEKEIERIQASQAPRRP